MPKRMPTKHALQLMEALRKRGVYSESEHWDGYKHVDIYIPKGKIYIEVDGAQHDIKVKQIISDFERDYYSAQEGFFTKHITNEEIDLHCDEIAKAISKIVDKGFPIKVKPKSLK